MEYNVRAETGNQLFARLSKTRPGLKGLDPRLLGEGPSSLDVIEVTGEPSVGKSMLLLQWISRATLPPTCGGLGVEVLFIDTDHQQPLSTLINIMESQAKEYVCAGVSHQRGISTVIDSSIKDALTRLHILRAYDSTQLHLALLSLDKFLSSNSQVSMVAIDSLSAFYWADRFAGGMQHMDSYLRQYLGIMEKSTREHRVTVAFTRPSHFQSAVSYKAKDGLSGSSVIINLTEIGKSGENTTNSSSNSKILYSAQVKSAAGLLAHHKYLTSKYGFVWI